MFNYLMYRTKYRYAKNLPLKKPVDVSIELSSACNQKCGYCYHADSKNLPFTRGIMKYEVAEKIIIESAKIGVHSLKFNWKGESSMHPKFFEITSLAKSLAKGATFIDRLSNSNFKFDTNKDEIFDGFCNQTKVKISFDSFIPEVMEKQRAGSIHAVALQNIDKFYNYPLRKKTKTQMVIQCVRTNLNKDEDLVTEIKKRWPDAGYSVRDMVAGRVDNSEVKDLEHKTRDVSERQSCIQAHARLIFNYKGQASPCCPDIGEKLNLGDVTKQSVAEIFNSQQAKQLRKSLKDKSAFELDPCKNCSSFESYANYKAPFHA